LLSSGLKYQADQILGILPNSGVARFSQGWFVGVPTAGGHRGLGDFCNFSIKITHFYAYFGQNSCFIAIIHRSKAFKISLNVLNRINEVHVL